MKKNLLFLAAMMTATGMNLNAETVTNVKYMDADGKEQTCAEATLVVDGPEGTWNAGWYVVMGSNVRLSQGAICNGEVHLILGDGAKLTATGIGTLAGIQASSDQSSISIYGQPNQTGKLIATGGYMGGAGIGGANTKPGMNITINGGVIEATGGGDSFAGYAAGIGGGGGKDGSNITINGGQVTAISSGNGASAIGAGDKGTGSNIFVNPALILKADNNNPPTTEIAHASIATDVASLLAGKQYATIEPKTPIVGDEFTIDNVNYQVTTIAPFEAQVADNQSYAGTPALVLPDTVEYKDTKLAVTSFISTNAFLGNKVITSVNITGNIKEVNCGTFNDCSNLSKVVLNEGIASLYKNCFQGDSLLDSITLPASLNHIDDAFSHNFLKWIDVADGNTTFASEEGVLYNAAKDTLLFYPAGNPRTEFVASKETKVIGRNAFYTAEHPYSISLPSVEVLNEASFALCPNLTSVEFSDKIDSLGLYALAMDTMLTTITCRATTPPALGEMVFYGVDTTKITLYVPAESISAYQAADVWKDMNIQPLATAIEEVEGQKSADAKVESQKYMREGQLIIERNKVRYNAQGQVVE